MGASFETGQGPVVSLIELKNGELVSGGDDGYLRRWQDGEADIGEACKELQEHPVLLSPRPTRTGSQNNVHGLPKR